MNVRERERERGEENRERERRNERKRSKEERGDGASLRAHENCMENKLRGQREHSCERIIRAIAFAQYASRRTHAENAHFHPHAVPRAQIHRVN